MTMDKKELKKEPWNRFDEEYLEIQPKLHSLFLTVKKYVPRIWDLTDPKVQVKAVVPKLFRNDSS